MEDHKIQLKHPQGKKAVSMSKDKYELLNAEIVQFLTDNTDATFTDMAVKIAQNFKDRNLSFEGSLNWHLEWVKLDLEAHQIITRVSKTSPQQYILTKR